ncbi:MAG: acyl carrier protein [Acidiferrobacter sp.]
MSDISDIRKDVMSIVETYGKLAGPVPPDRDLYSDLGVESVNAISILLALESRLGTTIDDTRFVEARTLNGLVDLVAQTKLAPGSQVA